MLRDWHGGDAGAAKTKQGRRFPTPGMTCIVNLNEETIDVDFAVKHYTKIMDSDEDELIADDDVQLTSTEKALYREVWQRKLQSSVSSQHPSGNKSAADFGLAIFIAQKGGNPSLALAAIISSRTTLLEDKGEAYARQYAQKTAISAFLKHEKNISAPKPKNLSI